MILDDGFVEDLVELRMKYLKRGSWREVSVLSELLESNHVSLEDEVAGTRWGRKSRTVQEMMYETP